MKFLHTDIGSAKDNFKSPIHNWYKFTAGFSYKFVDEIISLENLKDNKDSKVFEPFAGCGTTLVSSQKSKVSAIGNEGQEFMFDVIKAKLNWSINPIQFEVKLLLIKNYIVQNLPKFDYEKNTHQLLKTLYEKYNLTILYLIRDGLLILDSQEYKLFFKLALSQTLHKVSIHPIAVPYISRNKTLSNTKAVWDVFESIGRQMLSDINLFSCGEQTSQIYMHDSRVENSLIKEGECSVCITSPPYLNNLDYGEVSKVHTHFYEYTNSWSDVTQKVRKKLVTGATTHYTESDFNIDNFKLSEFYNFNKEIADSLIETTIEIKKISRERAGKKSFDILTLLYFNDMYDVLKEIRRVVKKDGKAYLILGDSAPYGVFIPTTKILGEIAKNTGFNDYEIHKIRARGTKWKSLKYRHSIELSENVLILK